MDLLASLRTFDLKDVLNNEPDRCRITLLGTLPSSWKEGVLSNDCERSCAIIRLEKTSFSEDIVIPIFDEIRQLELTESTDIYSWLAGWFNGSSRQPQGDLKINIICPATDVHIRKYSIQESIIVQETPKLYKTIVQPYIASFPAKRTQWVAEILEGRAEQSKILFSCPDYVLLPDMKWDLYTVGSLYIVAICRHLHIRSLRDLRQEHVNLLKSIRNEAYKICMEKWKIPIGGLRMWIHYQPSYYHFHVHIANSSYNADFGMAVGQAHLLEDVISLLEIDSDIFEKMTLTYVLGQQHGLYEAMKGE